MLRPSQELIVAMGNTTLGNVKNNSTTNGQISYPFYYTTIPINNPNYYTTQPPNPITNASTNENQGYSTSSTQHPYYGHPTERINSISSRGRYWRSWYSRECPSRISMQPLLHQANNNSASSATSTAPYPVYSMNVNVPYYILLLLHTRGAQKNTTSNTNAEPSGATSTNSGTMLSNPAYANSQYTHRKCITRDTPNMPWQVLKIRLCINTSTNILCLLYIQ
ncbi:CRE_collapsed_G0013790.mRNA.1.CDS.1 [Saccharomyces cerevisiae]|nr:CRE_collapsed_G0013790.mRNA.1.CDS.1 [Saccharomyces cerevisiae]